MWRMTWQESSAAADSVHGAEIDRRSRVTGVSRARVPVRRRRVVRRRHALPASRQHPTLNITLGNPASAPLMCHAAACSYSSLLPLKHPSLCIAYACPCPAAFSRSATPSSAQGVFYGRGLTLLTRDPFLQYWRRHLRTAPNNVSSYSM